MSLFHRPKTSGPVEDSGEGNHKALKILFLDDDEGRATAFLSECPHAVWVETAADCITKLEETWDEVHLDHDLGGEQFVDTSRDDCGMEVVRWICLTPRPHLKATHFFIHSHNPMAATVMGVQMTVSGFKCAVRPFGVSSEAVSELDQEFAPILTRWQKARRWVRHKLGLHEEIDPAFYDYLAQGRAADDALPELLDFGLTHQGVDQTDGEKTKGPDVKAVE